MAYRNLFVSIMENSLVKKICPLPVELSEIKKNILCTEEGCNRMFLNSSNLDMHLLKHHKKANKQFIRLNNSQMRYQYHCPIEKCSYNMNSERFFKNMKYLKQHFLKVHAEKNFSCEKCQKGFSTEAAKKKHVRLCGVKFTCSCSNSYDSYEALITHAKRYQHTFDERFKTYGKEAPPMVNVDSNNSCNAVNITQELQTSSTAIAVPVRLLAAVALSELSSKCLGTAVDKGVQTEARNGDSKRHRKAPSPCKTSERSIRRRTSTQTQTVTRNNKHPKISTETQTMGDYILKKAMRAADIPLLPKETKCQGTSKKRRKSMETQTVSPSNSTVYNSNNDQVMNFVEKYSSVADSNINFSPLNQFPLTSSSYTPLCNNTSPYRLDIDVGLPDIWLGAKNSSGTQTSPIALSTLMEHEEMLSDSVTQTDLNLALFGSESCESSSRGIHTSSSQTMTSLQSYFEDTSDSNFGSGVINPSVTFGPALTSSSCGTTMDALSTLSDEPGYSSEPMDRMLTGNTTKMIFDANKSCSTETQTDVNSSFCQCTDENDTSFTLCSNIETQTTEDLASLDQLLHMNMCTQTCDDFLFSDLGFVDIETQTAGDDSLLVSTETQTALSGCSDNNLAGSTIRPWFLANNSGGKPALSVTSHMETQTNTNEFRELIAALAKQEPDDKLL
ncbi:serine-rich adhesin for platelets isoform X2 [Anabrus simplex]|uniref:serine-rich adhesin for platelets isoform X2 n=1 Tax=Anabrus simplex TaxID=316456 RepID=UPI0035A3B90E